MYRNSPLSSHPINRKWRHSLLKAVAQTKLNNARVCGVKDQSEVWILNVAVRDVEVCVIEEVEGLEPEFEEMVFCDPGALECREVPVVEAWAAQGKAAQVAETPGALLKAGSGTDASEVKIRGAGR